MKVVYSVASKFGGSGIGNTAYNAVRGIYQAGYLQKIFCSSVSASNISNDVIFSTRTSVLERFPFLSSQYRWLIKDLVHDLIVSTTLLHSNVVNEKVDIFHVWNGHGLYSLRTARSLGAKIVVERASSHPLTFEKIMKEEYKKRGLKFSQVLSINKKRLLQEFRETDCITVPSDFSYSSMVENGVEKSKLVRLNFGVDLDFFCPAKKDKDSSIFRAIFVGQVGLRKGVLYLLEAWEKLSLSKAELIIVGQPDAEVKPFLKRYLNNSSIRFFGFRDTLPLYQSSDVFVFPSLEEGSALVTYEALACGLPVVTTLESGSIVEDGQEGFIVPSAKVDQLAERIQFLYQHRELIREMSVRARAKAEQFSWQSYGRKLVEAYTRMV